MLETSDLPDGVINIVTGQRDVLAKTLADHQEPPSGSPHTREPPHQGASTPGSFSMRATQCPRQWRYPHLVPCSYGTFLAWQELDAMWYFGPAEGCYQVVSPSSFSFLPVA